MKLMLGWVDTGAPVSVKPAILDPDLGRPACAPSSDCGLLTASPRMVPGAFLLTVVSLLDRGGRPRGRVLLLADKRLRFRKSGACTS